MEPADMVATLCSYSNTKFANLVLEQSFYSKLKAAAKELEVDPNVIINNALLLALKKVERLLKKTSEIPLIH